MPEDSVRNTSVSQLHCSGEDQSHFGSAATERDLAIAGVIPISADGQAFVIRTFEEIDNYNKPLSLDECWFYHTCDLPGHGVVRGQWDLRGSESAYIGHVDVAGKTVLDCGVGSGFISFEMERRGARVIGLDLDVDQDPSMGIVPHFEFGRAIGVSWSEAVAMRKVSQCALRNSFLYSRKLLRRHTKLMLGNIALSPLPRDLQADFAFFGAILLHLSDPVKALQNIARHVRETIIVTEPYEGVDLSLDRAPTMRFRPAINDYGNVGTWFYLCPALIRSALEVVGFTHFSVSACGAKYDVDGVIVPLFTVVASR
jgi:SAM-dependent methyltransferase